MSISWIKLSDLVISQELGLCLCASDPYIMSMIKQYIACFILVELNIHAYNFNLMHNLQIEADLIALLQTVGLRILHLQGPIIIAKLPVIVLNSSIKFRSKLYTQVLRLYFRILFKLVCGFTTFPMANGRKGEPKDPPKPDLCLWCHLHAGNGVPELIVTAHPTVFLCKLLLGNHL